MYLKMLKLLLPIFLTLFCQGLAQDRFIVFVSEYIGNIGSAVGRCPATIITDRHVLTTAACATPTNSSFQLAISIQMSFGSGYASRTISAERAFIHPNYTGDEYSNNVGVVLMGGLFNTTSLPPRSLGSIPSVNTTCRLFGWGGAPDNPETVEVVVHEPAYCFSDRPQAFCAEHSPPARACAALRGSPLVCNPLSVDGILLKTDCTEEDPGRFLQPYHSVDDFKEWIESVSGAQLVNQISTLLLLSALVISFNTAMKTKE
ncbi:Snake venom serine protease [Pseudolycoriella hygida]|uniref:Snake venom serine protease n=1 Tax=Pseudolycoriella hygida TaxID=35572 RepID=A0A9Q0N7P9_9DIPT|nr:Snake venom serine protease [Pseudolycoriella hygida]